MRLLDLYCGAGLAAHGYWDSGCVSDIVGVDVNPEMGARYSFNFWKKSAIDMTYDDLAQFDLIHASPPCQGYSNITPDQSAHMRLVAATHLMCHASGRPYVIENVPNSQRDLRPNVAINGGYFNLPIERLRYFHVSILRAAVRLIKRPRLVLYKTGGAFVPRDDVLTAFGISGRAWANNVRVCDIEQGFPPIYTTAIAHLLDLPRVMSPTE